MILRGSGPVLLKSNYFFFDFRGEVQTNCPPPPPPPPPPRLDPHMHFILLWVKVGLTSCWFSSALVYAPLHHKWTYLWRMIALLFAQLCITEFYLGRDQSQIRIKSEVGTVKYVEALQFFFLLAQISSIVFLNVKNLAYIPYCGVCVLVLVGGQDVITIKTSTMTPLSATVSRVRVGQWLRMHFTFTTRVGTCVR